MRCNICIGSGKVMGGGMIFHSCMICAGSGKIELDLVKKKENLQEIITESTHYKKAIKNIKSLDSKITDEQAKEMFSEELKKIEEKDNENEYHLREKNKRT